MISEYIKLRNDALKEFDKTGDIHLMKRLYERYGLDVPEDSVLIRAMQEAIKEGHKCISK